MALSALYHILVELLHGLGATSHCEGYGALTLVSAPGLEALALVHQHTACQVRTF